MKRLILWILCLSQFLIIFSKKLQASDYSASSKLNKIILPSGLSLIGERAFYSCTGLNSFTIPETVVSIGSEAFGNCSNLQWLYSNSLKPADLSNSPDVFKGVDKANCKLNVPDGSLSLYKEAFQWKDFFEIGDSFDRAYVKVNYENDELVFHFYGDVIGLILDMTEYRQFLGVPEITGTVANSLINITDSTFVIEISNTIYQSDGQVFMKIPVTTGEISNISIELTINGISNQVMVDPATENSEITNSKISVYPNPVRHTLFISGVDEYSEISIFDLNGKMISGQKENNGNIDVSEINPGIYILVIQNNSGKVMKKFVKQ